jgi:hypothetical protein
VRSQAELGNEEKLELGNEDKRSLGMRRSWSGSLGTRDFEERRGAASICARDGVPKPWERGAAETPKTHESCAFAASATEIPNNPGMGSLFIGGIGYVGR